MIKHKFISKLSHIDIMIDTSTYYVYTHACKYTNAHFSPCTQDTHVNMFAHMYGHKGKCVHMHIDT